MNVNRLYRQPDIAVDPRMLTDYLADNNLEYSRFILDMSELPVRLSGLLHFALAVYGFVVNHDCPGFFLRPVGDTISISICTSTSVASLTICIYP